MERLKGLLGVLAIIFVVVPIALRVMDRGSDWGPTILGFLVFVLGVVIVFNLFYAHRSSEILTKGNGHSIHNQGGTADDLNEAARAASKEGNHALAERLFHQSWLEHRNVHSAANEVYERYLQGKSTAEEVQEAVHNHGIADGNHGQWLLRQVSKSE